MTSGAADRARAVELDATDPLGDWRDEFVVTDPELVYLDGNSLGMAPKRTVEAIRRTVERDWANDLITSWWEHDWLDLPLTVGDELAPLIGARPGEVAVHDSTTVCLFQLVNVALDLAEQRSPGAPRTIAVAASEFPTDRYVADGISRMRPEVSVRRGLEELGGVDVVVRSLVDYPPPRCCRSPTRPDAHAMPAPSRCGTCRMPLESSTSTSPATASIWLSGAPTSSSTAGPARLRSRTCEAIFTTG